VVQRREQSRGATLDPVGGVAQFEVLGSHRRIDHALDISLEQPLDRGSEVLDHPTIITSRCDTQTGPTTEKINKYRRDARPSH